jgi:hypothetical protein
LTQRLAEECLLCCLLGALMLTIVFVNVLKVSRERAGECACAGLEVCVNAQWAASAP